MIKSRELSDPNSCMCRAKDHEMTFVLLARDKAAPVAIRAWVAERIRLGKNVFGHDPQIEEALSCAKSMEEQSDTVSPKAAEASGGPDDARILMRELREEILKMGWAVSTRPILRDLFQRLTEQLGTFPAPAEPPHVACSCPMCCPGKHEINAALAAEHVQEVCGKAAHNRFGIIHCDLPPNHEGDCDFGKVTAEPVAGETRGQIAPVRHFANFSQNANTNRPAPVVAAPDDYSPFEPPETAEQQNRRIGQMIRRNADKRMEAASTPPPADPGKKFSCSVCDYPLMSYLEAVDHAEKFRHAFNAGGRPENGISSSSGVDDFWEKWSYTSEAEAARERYYPDDYGGFARAFAEAYARYINGRS